MSRSLTSFLFALMATMALANLNCLDRSGNAVSWFTAIRFPDSVTNTSARYAYLDVNSGSAFEVVSGVNVDDAAEPLAKTIDTINALSGDNKNLLVLTNTPPNGTLINTGAHAKAIIAFDNQTQTGVYILYSFLSYPDVDANGNINSTIPLSGNQYAEMNGPDGNYLYCVSFDTDLLSVITELLPNEQPNILYSSGLFSNMVADSDFMFAVRAFQVPGTDFQWFMTKSPNANWNMYDDLIAPAFTVQLAVTSSGNETANCTSGANVVNIDSIVIDSDNTWSSANDNSKWAVAILASLDSVYLCDNDRTEDQDNRGGSCFATTNENMYAAFLNIAKWTDSCPQQAQKTKSVLPQNYMDIISN